MNKPFIESTATVAKINVTPIIDVALVLLIILMVTAPMIAVTDMEISLPAAATRSLDEPDRVTLTVGYNGNLAVDDDDVTHAELAGVLSQRFANSEKDNVLIVRADESLPYATVQELISEAKAAGAQRIAIATRQRGGQGE